MHGISSSSKNKKCFAIKTTNEQANKSTKRQTKARIVDDVCLNCNDKKCRGTKECMEKHRRLLNGTGKNKENMG